MPATLALGKGLCGLHEDPFSQEQAEKQQGQNCFLIPAPCEAAPAGPALCLFGPCVCLGVVFPNHDHIPLSVCGLSELF